MTLYIGDHVVKLGIDGKPIGDQESYVEFEVTDLSPTYCQGEKDEAGQYPVVQFAKLRKVH